jgi:hypothetical protein
VPRARLTTSEGGTTEWKSQALRAYQRRALAADALIASTYLAGTNTRRVRRALAALFGGTVENQASWYCSSWRGLQSDASTPDDSRSNTPETTPPSIPTNSATGPVSLALLYLALRGINFAAIQSRLSQINIGWIALAVLITVVQIFIGALRWREISDQCQAPLTDLQAFRYNMIGAFFNQTLPSSIGGDAVRIWLANRTGAGWRAATYSILTDRAVGLIALALIIVASLP